MLHVLLTLNAQQVLVDKFCHETSQNTVTYERRRSLDNNVSGFICMLAFCRLHLARELRSLVVDIDSR